MPDKGTSIGGVEVREVHNEVGETGVGVENRTDVVYELGVEIDGAWVPFGAQSASRVDSYQRAAASQAEAANDGSSDPDSEGA
jgi:hypothetical protein